MSTPTGTARSTPVGNMLDDGYQSLITFEADPDISIWEKTTKPPGVDGGDPIPISTMHNVTLRTFAPRGLRTMTGGGMTVAYDPRCLPQIIALINVETTITQHFPDGTGWAYYGFLQTFEPGDLQEGEQPEATCVIGVTNVDPATGEEEDPNYDTTPGT